MSRSRSTRSEPRAASRRSAAGNTLIGLFVGLVIGVLGAAAVVWYIYKTPAPFKAAPAPTTPPPTQAAPAPGSTATAPQALPGKPGDPVPAAGDKPRFDFYKILPGNAEAIPEPKATEPKGKESGLSEPLFLQTGSFQNANDADGQKAKLALLGAEASVQQVMLQDKTWYRVRLGPFRKMEELNQIRSELAKQGINAQVVKKD